MSGVFSGIMVLKGVANKQAFLDVFPKRSLGIGKTLFFFQNILIFCKVKIDYTTETPYSRLFFLTPAAEKTKTQGQNSSKKLKEKTQP